MGDEEEVVGDLNKSLAAKRAAKYDKGLEKTLREWIATLVPEHSDEVQNTAESFQNVLKSGVILCKLVNAVCPGAVKKINKNKLPFMQMENITSFLSACRKLGFAESERFVTVDLFEGKNMSQVLLSLNILKTMHSKLSQDELVEMISGTRVTSISRLGSQIGKEAFRTNANEGKAAKRRTLGYAVGAEPERPATDRGPTTTSAAVVVSPVSPSPSARSEAAPAADRMAAGPEVGPVEGLSSGRSPMSHDLRSSGSQPVSSRDTSTPQLAVPSLDDDMKTREQFKYSHEMESAAKKWIADVMEEPFPNHGTFAEVLKTGVLLCNLVNKIRPDTITRIHKTKIGFHHIENIKSYLTACEQHLGLTTEDNFQTSDLYNEKGMTLVVQQLHRLANQLSKTHPDLPKIEATRTKNLWVSALSGGLDIMKELGTTEPVPLSEEEEVVLRWANGRVSAEFQMENFSTDLRSGVKLLMLLEAVSGTNTGAVVREPKSLYEYMQNASSVFRFLNAQYPGELPKSISPNDIVMGNHSPLCQLMAFVQSKWDLDLFFQNELKTGEDANVLRALDALVALTKGEEGEPMEISLEMINQILEEKRIADNQRLGLGDSVDDRDDDDEDEEEMSDEVSEYEYISEEEDFDEDDEMAGILDAMETNTAAKVEETPEAPPGSGTLGNSAASGVEPIGEDAPVKAAGDADAESTAYELPGEAGPPSEAASGNDGAAKRSAISKEPVVRKSSPPVGAPPPREADTSAKGKKEEEDSVVLKGDSVVVKGDSVVAKDDSVVAKDDSVAAKDDSVVVKDDSVVVKDDSVVSKDNSVVAKDDNADAEKVPSPTAPEKTASGEGLSAGTAAGDQAAASTEGDTAADDASVASLSKSKRLSKRKSRRLGKEKVVKDAVQGDKSADGKSDKSKKDQKKTKKRSKSTKDGKGGKLEAADPDAATKKRHRSKTSKESKKEEPTTTEGGEAEKKRKKRKEDKADKAEKEDGKAPRRSRKTKKTETSKDGAAPSSTGEESTRDAQVPVSSERTVPPSETPTGSAGGASAQTEDASSRGERGEETFTAADVPIIFPEGAQESRAKSETGADVQSADRGPTKDANQDPVAEGAPDANSGEIAHVVPIQGQAKQRKKVRVKKRVKRGSPAAKKARKSSASRSFISKNKDTLPSTTDLLVLQQKMQTAQNSVRRRIAMELAETERSYVKGIKSVLEEIIIPLKQEDVSKEDLEGMFGNLPDLVPRHETLLDRLEERIKEWTPESIISDIFKEHGDFFEMYKEYVSNFHRANIYIKFFAFKNSKISTLITKFKTKRKKTSGLAMDDFVVMPVQRVPRYALLLREMIKYSNKAEKEYDALQELLTNIQGTLDRINGSVDKRELQVINGLLNIEGAVEGFTQYLVESLEQGRNIIIEGEWSIEEVKRPLEKGGGTFRKKSKFQQSQYLYSVEQKDRLYAYLFHDILIFCAAKEDASEEANKRDAQKGRLFVENKPYMLQNIVQIKNVVRVSNIAREPTRFSIDLLGDEQWTIAVELAKDSSLWMLHLEHARMQCQQSKEKRKWKARDTTPASLQVFQKT